MTIPDKLRQLIERFDANLSDYKQGKYNETQVRREFIDPLFQALGWDVTNRQGYAEAYKEVVHEDAIKIGRATKAPDYSFRIGGVRKFFVEAKKPSVYIKEDIHPAYQLRRYAWSAKLPLSILTDFEEFAVYDCRIKPEQTDKASTARIMYLTFTEYAAKWEELLGIFSKDAILKGAFDRYAESTKTKKGTAEVDVAFLQEIERWRDLLARNLALRNPQLTRRDLNFAVQRTIDRIIFLRICEDRGVEAYGKLQVLLNGANVYTRLLQLFYQADDRYDSGIFHFKTERDHAEAPDGLTPSLQIDDKVLKDILNNLYYPDSPYEFSVLPADILGQVYEQFLGKVIRLTDGHQAKVEEKPEVKKAGGVYYTPTYIVEYIVKQTVGKLLEQQDLTGFKNLSGLKLTILDPACGSGSFLIGAYQYLLDWYRAAYLADHAKWSKGRQPRLYQNAQGEWKLTVEERKRILLSHIYGVDIDSQAVEVTKLSLLLKVLEGEDEQTLNSQLSMFQKRVLPDLSNNIKCGNSLIGSDAYQGEQLTLIDEEERYRVNAFDWDREFSEIVKKGGFDAVIGNPPYVRSINLKASDEVLWNLYRSHYQTASAREWDIYLIFVEKGLSLLKQQGKLGYILPNKFLNSQVGENLRTIIAKGQYLEKLVHFDAFQIFSGATTYTCLLFLEHAEHEHVQIARYVGSVKQSGMACPLPEELPDVWKQTLIPASKLTSIPWEFAASGGAILEKLRQWPGLENIAQVFKGTGTDADKVYAVEKRGIEGEFIRIYSPEKDAEYLVEPTYLKPALRGRSIQRYGITDQNLFLIVPYEIIEGKSILVSKNKLELSAPRTLAYLRECKQRLDEREQGRFKNQDGWYAYGYPRSMTKFDRLKIVMPDVCNRGKCWLENQAHWLIDTAYGIIPLHEKIDLRYLLGILNSPLLTYFLKETGTALRGGYFRMKTAYLNPFPIRNINFSDSAEKTQHDKLVELVERMLTLHKQLAEAANPQAHALLQRQIETTDRQIDRLVYELYGLTEEEIAIVEKS